MGLNSQPIPETDTMIGHMTDPVGAIEIGERLGVETATVHSWVRFDQIPEPTYESVNGTRAWEWGVVLLWAGETGRLRTEAVRDEYRRVFGSEPSAPRTAGRQSSLSDEDREDIISGGAPAGEAANRYGISEATVFKIRRQAKAAGRKVPTPPRRRRPPIKTS